MDNMQQKMYQETGDGYFAARKPEECAASALNKAQSFYNTLRSNAYLEKLKNMWRAYYGAYSQDVGYGHKITFTGEQGELVQLPVNHFHNIARHIYTMITANRPTLEARAVNTDYKSLSQTYLANGILDYYMREKHLERTINDAVEMAIVLGSSFVKLEWNATSGEAYDIDPETGEINYEGELETSLLSPFDVVYDGTKETWNHDWILVRSFQNRFNLIAKYPELADKIKGIPTKAETSVYRLAVFSNDETDDIAVYEFYHKRTEAMPEGRYLLFLDSDCILLDAKLPYRVIPIFRIAPENILGTPYGYSPMFDVLPIQEALNAQYSAIMTNQNAFAVQNIYVPRGADINVNSLDGAMNIIEGNAKPEPLNLAETPAEVFKYLEMLVQAAETISGVNSVARGNPEASLRSGNALALVQAMAIQFMSGLQQSYIRLLEDVGTSLIQILKDFATTPKVIALVGKNNKPYLKEFTGEDINAINRVIVDVGNPLARTTAGRVQMAEQMLQMGVIKNPQQYFQVMNTGRLDVTYEGEMNELLLIKSENERLLEGESTIASLLDAHRMHIMEHKSVLADPELRKNPQLVQNTLNHIQQHIDYLRNSDPDLLQLIGEQPLNPMSQQGDPNLPPGPMTSPQQPPPGPVPGMPQPELGQAVLPGMPMQSELLGQAPMPGLPTPPAPFNNLPVNPQDLLPK